MSSDRSNSPTTLEVISSVVPSCSKTSTLKKLGNRFGRIGAELGREMALRMPIIDFMKLNHNLGGEIVDAKFADLNKDKVLELIVIQKNSRTESWIQIFEWNGIDFTLNGNPFSNGEGNNDKVRPSNLSYNNGVFSAAISSPTRSAKSFGVMIEDGEYTVVGAIALAVMFVLLAFTKLLAIVFTMLCYIYHPNATAIAAANP